MGPWGGGNKFVSGLSEALRALGHEVVHDLYPHSVPIDVIFCFDPRSNKMGHWYGHMLAYKNRFGCKIIQRVGDVGTHGKPELTRLVKSTVQHSDFLIFPSNWAKDYIEYTGRKYLIIDNAPLEVFHKYKNPKKIGERVNLITHHWSTNPKKGFSFYQQLDEFVGQHEHFSFTYVGRLPGHVQFKNAKHIAATGDNDLIAREISASDLYVTASEEEAGANHVLEALAAGLPVLYHKNGGSIPEYCAPYGKPFDDFTTFRNMLDDIVLNYEEYKDKVLSYEYTITQVIDQYKQIIGV